MNNITENLFRIAKLNKAGRWLFYNEEIDEQDALSKDFWGYLKSLDSETFERFCKEHPESYEKWIREETGTAISFNDKELVEVKERMSLYFEDFLKRKEEYEKRTKNIEESILPLKTERLIIRNFEESDWEAHFKLRQNKKTNELLMLSSCTEDKARKLAKKWSEQKNEIIRGEYELAIIRRSDNEFIGQISLDRGDAFSKELAFSLFEDCQGQGYGTEALKCIIEFGFKYFKLHRIYGGTYSDNFGAQKIMKKAGMVNESIIRERLQKNGKWINEYGYSILENDKYESVIDNNKG